MRKTNKFVVYALCCGLIGSSFTPITGSMAADAVNSISEMVTGKKMIGNEPEMIPWKPATIKNHTETIYEGENSNGDLFGDRFDIPKKELEVLLEEGNLPSDLFKAEDLANEYTMDPKEILHIKKNANKNWDHAIVAIEEKLFKPTIDQYKDQYVAEYQIILGENLTIREQATLLRQYHSRGKNQVSMTEMIQFLKTDKRGWEAKFVATFKEHKLVEQVFVSQEKQSKYGLTAADVVGMKEKTFDRLVKIASKENVPVKTVLSNYKQQLLEQRQKEVR